MIPFHLNSRGVTRNTYWFHGFVFVSEKNLLKTLDILCNML